MRELVSYTRYRKASSFIREGIELLLKQEEEQPSELPRRLIHAEGDHPRFLCHSLSSFALGRDRRLNPIRPSAVLFMDGR
jgi:Arc/MetJ-type ribon-helix-helix transcriptional regulator